MSSASRIPSGNALVATAITVRRGGRALLDAASITLTPGRVTAVVGPNGAGKSTLLRVLSGELAPDAGSVSVQGRPLAAWPAAELARVRAVLPQESDLRFPFRVTEVVRLGRIPHPGGGDTLADHAIAAAALARVDLTPLADRLYPSLSGGEKQRVHLARALAQLQPAPPPPPSSFIPHPSSLRPPPSSPRVLLLDEPTAALDLAHQHSVLALARELALGEGVAVLAILHDLNLVLAYADDLVVLSGGRVVASGPVEATLTPELVREVFAVPARLLPSPAPGGRPQLLLGPSAL